MLTCETGPGTPVDSSNAVTDSPLRCPRRCPKAVPRCLRILSEDLTLFRYEHGKLGWLTCTLRAYPCQEKAGIVFA
jgi:hypothetical protein